MGEGGSCALVIAVADGKTFLGKNILTHWFNQLKEGVTVRKHGNFESDKEDKCPLSLIGAVMSGKCIGGCAIGIGPSA